MLILIEHALRHTPSGGALTVTADREDRSRARRTVQDTGEGLLAEHLPYLFDRFYLADGARDRSSGGTDSGLAIATAIAQLHGGRIAVSSRAGRDPNFTGPLPAAAPTGGETIADRVAPRLPTAAPPR